MKIAGESVEADERFEDVPIGTSKAGKTLMVRLYAPPPSVMDRISAEFPVILPPKDKGFVRGPDGKPALDLYKRPIPNRNTEDPGYLAKIREASNLENIAVIVACARDVTWDAQRETFGEKGAHDYYRAIRAELEKGRISAAALMDLTRAASRLCNTLATVDERATAREALGAPEELSPKP